MHQSARSGFIAFSMAIRQNVPFRQFARFVAVGAVNTGVSYLVFLTASHRLPYQLAYAAAYAAGIVTAYQLNTRFVFGGSRSVATALAYPFVYVAQYLLGALVLHLAIEWTGISPRWAALAAILITIPVSFVLNRAVLKRRL